MSMEAQLPTNYNEGTSGSSHSNLDPMKVIMQELQLMRKNMKEMRGDITNVSMEHRDHRNIGGHDISQNSGTTSRPLSYNNLKLPLLSGAFGSHDYEILEKKVESLFYSYGVREEKFQLVVKSLSYEVNFWWIVIVKKKKENEIATNQDLEPNERSITD
ncbi:hypothetical protein M9H77_03735 [Catharanthus roseus]|uniref:Uncharacterized protein n=1 Tax=Catharanthus roseus TaxID=4058 RepID=A0ACC0CC29_CATRO|nr:hypothetical protein M9H77_03735 [Catharanthus roseus]